MYITSSRLSRTFFKSFSTSGPLCISSNFLSLPHSGSFVKNFFQEVLSFRFPVICGNLFRLPHLVAAVKCFFISLCGAVLTAPTALLEYQILPLLSIPFSRFFIFLIAVAISPAFVPFPLAQVGKISCANGGDSGIMSMEIKCIHSRRD